MKRKESHIRLGLTVFLTVSAILLFYDTLFGRRVLLDLGRQFMGAVKPILYGAFIAYLLAPMVNFFEAPLRTKEQKPGRFPTMGPRAVSLLMTWIVICVMFYLLVSVLLPELYKSVVQLIGNVENYYLTISGWVEHMLETYPTVENWVTNQMEEVYTTAKIWVKTDLLPHAQAVMIVVSGGVLSIFSFFGDLLVGVIVSVYLLAAKERCGAAARKLVFGLCSSQNVTWVLRGVHKVDSIFSGFVRGKLLDSLIIGGLCFLGCSALKMPYTPLVSVVVGVTNIIPYFGPFLGAIPSAFLILLVSPRKMLYFALFIFALQQLDGNVIGPKILGDKTGLSSLWVITAILIGGSFFGIPGMFFGVPVLACLYSAVNFYINSRLRRKAMPLAVNAYTTDHPTPEDLPVEKTEE